MTADDFYSIAERKRLRETNYDDIVNALLIDYSLILCRSASLFYLIPTHVAAGWRSVSKHQVAKEIDLALPTKPPKPAAIPAKTSLKPAVKWPYTLK